MGSHEAEISTNSEAAIKELDQVRRYVAQLASLLAVDMPEARRPESGAAQLLLEEIFGRLSTATAILESGQRSAFHEVDSPSSCVTTNKGNSGGKRKVQATRKVNYRRRGNSYSWTKVTSSTTDDGHTWRKYGQKDIFSSKYPRSYYRCTHKFDRGCKASRQVQRSEDDPSSYVITYFGEHTCGSAAKVISPCGNPPMIRFESNSCFDVKQETQSPLPSLRQEGEEEVISNLSSIDSPSDYFVSPEMEMREAGAVGAQQIGSLSCSHPSIPGYEMEFFDIDSLLCFDHVELFQV